MSGMARKKAPSINSVSVHDKMANNSHAEDQEKIVQLNIKIKESVRRQLHAAARMEGKNIASVLNELIDEYLKNKHNKKI